MISGPLLRWEIRRLRWWYYGILLFWLGGFIFTLCLTVPGQPVHWENVDFLWFGAFWAIFWGGGLFVGKFRDGTMEFLLARPVSRREVYHSIVLAGGIPLVFLVTLPSLFALTLPPWKTSHLFLTRLLALNLLEAAWVIAGFLLSAFVYLLTGGSNRWYARYIEIFFMALVVGVLAGIQKANLSQLIETHPSVSLVLSLTVGCLFYGLGRWRFEKMDIRTNSG